MRVGVEFRWSRFLSGRLGMMSRFLTRMRGVIIAGAAMSLVLASCGASTSASSSTTAVSTAPKTLVIDQSNSPATLDPGLQYDSDSVAVYRNIFDQLLRRNQSTMKIVPWVATSWKNVNPTTWIFNIRKGIKFTNGMPLTGADVAFSINRILSPSFASPQFANFSVIQSATAKGQVVTIVTKAPSATLLTYLTTLSIVPEQYVQQVGNQAFDLHPIGSGPYKLVKWVQGSEVLLAANNSYWAGKPPYPSVEFRTVPNAASRVADLQSGAADIALTLSPDNAAQLKGSTGIKVIADPTEAVADLYMNSLQGPTQSLQVRKAIAYAINYSSLIKNVNLGYAKPVKEVLTPDSFGYTNTVPGFSYDPAKAKQLLAASGNPHPSLVFPTSPAFSPTVVQAIQADLEAVGFRVSIVTTDQPTFLQKIQSPAHNWGQIRYGIWNCGCADADGTIYPLFHSGSVWSSYSNAQFDQLVTAARTTLNTAQRKQDYREAFAVLQKTVPAVGLWQYYAIYGVNKNITWNPGPQETLFIPQIHWKG